MSLTSALIENSLDEKILVNWKSLAIDDKLFVIIATTIV